MNERERFDKLAVAFWREYCEAVKPICEKYGMGPVVSGCAPEYDIESASGHPTWKGWQSRSVDSVEYQIWREDKERES